MTRWLGYIAMSLDGRIADRDHGLDWLHAFSGGESGDAGYAAFYAGVDALVMGRTTHDVVASLGAWPYPGKPCYVVTSRRLAVLHPDVEAVPPDFPALRRRIAAKGHAAVWIVGGGLTLRAALEAGMLDQMRLFVVPVLVGEGPALFGPGAPQSATLRGTRTWPPGLVEIELGFDSQSPEDTA